MSRGGGGGGRGRGGRGGEGGGWGAGGGGGGGGGDASMDASHVTRPHVHVVRRSRLFSPRSHAPSVSEFARSVGVI